MVENGKKKIRIDYIDLLRAFGIIFMIMGHIKFGGHFDKWIHAFHMPMFFFVSGYFFRRRDKIVDQIKKRINCLLLPYIIFEVLQWLILMIFIPEYKTVKTLFYIFFENTYKITVEKGTFGISPIPGAMWFLTAIFFCEFIYIFLDKILRCNWKLHITVAIISLTGMLVPSILNIHLPWALDASFVGVGFYHLARVIHNSRASSLLRIKLIPTCMIELIVTCMIMLSPKVNMRTGNYGWYLPFWINACGSIIVGLNLARLGESFLMHGKLLNTVYNWLKGIGRNSIVYLCLNQIIILITTTIVYVSGVNGFISKIFIFMLTMGILYILEKLICETRIRKIIGR